MRQEKQMLLDEIREKLDRSSSFVIMKYQGLSANAVHSLRLQVGEQGGDVEVVRKRVLFKAAEQAGIKLDESACEGHIGLVFAGDDPIAMTKTVFKFSKDFEKAINVVGGLFEGQMYNADDVKKLSELPGKDEMRAQLLSVFVAPMSQTLATMGAVLTSVIYCLDNKSKQSEGAGV